MTIGEGAYGAQQNGFSIGDGSIAIIESYCYAARQNLANTGTAIIRRGSYGAQQNGDNDRLGMIMEEDCIGAMQCGVNYGIMSMGVGAWGAQQHGGISVQETLSGNSECTATATNNAKGAMQLFSLTNGQHAFTTTNGAASILLGAGTSSNRNAIVAGDGQESHGDGSITAGGGFYGSGGSLTGLTVGQVAGAVAIETGSAATNLWAGTAAQFAALSVTNPATVYFTW
jgi:hypothetical protein